MNSHYKKVVCIIFLGGFNLISGFAQNNQVTQEYIGQLFEEVSNWGRWGESDEMGTLNLITEKNMIEAAGLVTNGVTVSLAFDMDKKQGLMNPNPLEHQLQIAEFAGDTWAVDTYSMNYHGYAFSHIDALCHLIYQGKMYNGYSQEYVKPSGSERLGIQNMSKGIFTRGILFDAPALKEVPFLEPGTAILPEDLETWEQKTGIRVGAGDVLLIRTGRWARVAALGEWNYTELAVGLHPSVVKWLKDRDVAVLGSDGASERYPSGLEHSQSPIHFLAIYGLGMPILDNLNLEDLAKYAEEQNRYEFLFVAAPLRVEGGTGSPVNPIAAF